MKDDDRMSLRRRRKVHDKNKEIAFHAQSKYIILSLASDGLPAA